MLDNLLADPTVTHLLAAVAGFLLTFAKARFPWLPIPTPTPAPAPGPSEPVLTVEDRVKNLEAAVAAISGKLDELLKK